MREEPDARFLRTPPGCRCSLLGAAVVGLIGGADRSFAARRIALVGGLSCARCAGEEAVVGAAAGADLAEAMGPAVLLMACSACARLWCSAVFACRPLWPMRTSGVRMLTAHPDPRQATGRLLPGS